MKRYDVVTLFPEMFDAIADSGITGRALDKKLWALHCWNPRDFVSDKYKTIDDRPFGGGPGMVMKAAPIADAIKAAKARQATFAVQPKVIYLSPQARPMKDADVRRLSAEAGIVFLCGRYEGIDERVIQAEVDEEISIGDYVLSGGELAAMVVIDAMLRLLPGVLNDGESSVEDSYSPARDGLLDHPHYTRPDVWNDDVIPSVLMSGNHQEIARWRRRMAIERTWLRRPDLLNEAALTKEELQWLYEIKMKSSVL
ncbi:MAG: tRNA (guanosine(37)-N1)-methyltransferase TrmD [Gammaproteobacteria bacterium]|nr:tRNA (guanosine(37)-N1)-methyltransferase TrmD [Gammaproteobacteria bacterium]